MSPEQVDLVFRSASRRASASVTSGAIDAILPVTEEQEPYVLE
jgi:hypothetical protein